MEMTAPTGAPIGTDPTRPVRGMCQCGCGEPTPRRYRPGHDAKHHSTLAAALRGEWRRATRAADLLFELGWTSYADRADLRAVPYRASNGIAAQLVHEVKVWQVTPCGQHHSNRKCPALTAQAKAAGRINQVTKLAADGWLEFVPNTPELSARLVCSWDQCTECSTDQDRAQVAEHREMAVASMLDPADPADRKIRKSSPTQWTIEPDLPGQAPMLVFWNHLTNVITRGRALPTPVAS